VPGVSVLLLRSRLARTEDGDEDVNLYLMRLWPVEVICACTTAVTLRNNLRVSEPLTVVKLNEKVRQDRRNRYLHLGIFVEPRVY